MSPAPAGDRRRLVVTALLVYALFANPVLVNPMTWSALDAARVLLGLIILIFAAGLQKIIVLCPLTAGRPRSNWL